MSGRGNRILAIVPARGGSRGVPGKNLAEVGGVPLVGHALHFAAAVPEIDRCVVSTDDAQIAAAATDLGAEVPFVRPAHLAADDTPMAPVLRHALETVESAGDRFGFVVLLMPTTPVRRAADLSRAIAELRACDADGAVSVAEPPFQPVFVGVRKAGDGTVSRYFDEGSGIVRRQDADRFLRVTGQFYVWRAEFVRRLERSWLDEGRHLGVETADFAAQDIDTPGDLERVRRLVAAGLLKLPSA